MTDESPPGWQQTQNARYLALVRERIAAVDLTWTRQVVGIIREQLAGRSQLFLKDIGCQAFQLYKEIARQGLAWEYLGYELEPAYLDIGLEYFPELAEWYVRGDFTLDPSPRTTDVSVTSATIEHVDRWPVFLDNMLRSTRDLAVIRTMVGGTTERSLARTPGASADHPIWQFGTTEFVELAAKAGFAATLIDDVYTLSRPVRIPCGSGVADIVRTYGILVCSRQ